MDAPMGTPPREKRRKTRGMAWVLRQWADVQGGGYLTCPPTLQIQLPGNGGGMPPASKYPGAYPGHPKYGKPRGDSGDADVHRFPCQDGGGV